MRNSKIFMKRMAFALSALLLVSAVGLAQVTVSLPTVTGTLGSTQAIPITVGSLAGQGVISFQTTISYNKAVIKFTNPTFTGTLSAGLPNNSVNNDTANGMLTIVAAGTSALTGTGGTLVILNATMVGKGTSALTFSSFQFNEGTPAVTLTNGQAIVPAISVTVSSITTTSVVGGAFALPITTESLTGQTPGVVSYQFTLTYDPTKINLTGVSATGTLSSAMSTQYNTATAGQIKVVAAGSVALTGAGTLINITGTVVGAGSSAVNFTAFQFNEGTPAGGGVGGTVTIGVPQKPVLISKTPATLTTASQNNIVAFQVRAADPSGSAVSYTWKLNGAVVKGPSADSTYSVRFTDPHGTAKVVTCIYTTIIANLSDSTTWNFTITGVNDPVPVPNDFALGQNYPNPFNPTTIISYSLPKEAPVTFEVYNMLGVKVRTLLSGETRSAGTYTLSWDGRNDAGVSMPSGVYLYRVVAGSYMASKKMTMLK